ncbi:unnamed protein product [Lymnaea stagnalis]|uniref:Dephospho-CoA kinase domain-containing protein n=1 Tax=Lymnaea stagnalis TaxID=6523 RepID=A0AAV2H487_LYMST
MFLVGLTGGIASGKSTVTKIFREDLNCACIDADIIARKVVEPGKPAYKKIRSEFGDEILLMDGKLNRDKLGSIIFHDAEKRQKLNAIVHPAIKKQMLWEICLYFLKGYQFVILDIPLLFETKQMLPYISFSIVVFCHEDQQLQRLMERNKLSEEDARARMRAQLSLSEKCSLCTYTIDNTGSKELTRQNVLQVHSKLCASKKHLFIRLGLLLLCFVAFGACKVFL